jgi:hypothetical protein
MKWIVDCRKVLAEALLEVTRAARGLKEELDTELPEIPVPDPGNWEICQGVSWPRRYKDGDKDGWYSKFVFRSNSLDLRDLPYLAGRIMEQGGWLPSRILQVILELERLRDHLVRLLEQRRQQAGELLKSPREQEALAEIEARAALGRDGPGKGLEEGGSRKAGGPLLFLSFRIKEREYHTGGAGCPRR